MFSKDPSLAHSFSVCLFVDDTSLTTCRKDIDELIHFINCELPNIYDRLFSDKNKNLLLSNELIKVELPP